MRKFLLDAVKDENVVDGYKLKMLIGVTFGIMGDTLEMQQLHELQLAYDKRFTAIKQEIKLLRYAILAVAAVFTGANLGEFIRLFGLG